MRAETDRNVTEKLAQARKEAEILRGQGDAERNRVFAEAFEQDPEFFSFYRSMQAYAKSLGTAGHDHGAEPRFGVLQVLRRAGQAGHAGVLAAR